MSKYICITSVFSALSEILMGGYRCVSKKEKTLRNILLPSLVYTKPLAQPTWLRHKGSFIFAHTSCICCSHMDVSDSFHSFVTSSSYDIKQYINCNSIFVVYLISCMISQVPNVGSTCYCLVDTCLMQQRYHINISAVLLHCIEAHNRNTCSVMVQAIEMVNLPLCGEDHVRQLCNHEVFWVFLLKTCSSNGPQP